MSDQEAQGEPSMEEILASIRRIISEDDPEGEGEATPASEAPEEAALEEVEDEDDILELTEEVEEEVVAESEEEPVVEVEEPAEPEDSIEDDFRQSMDEPAEEPTDEPEEPVEFEEEIEEVSFDEEVEEDVEEISFDEEVEEVAMDPDVGNDIDLDAPDADSILQETTQDSTSSALSEIARAAVVQRSLAIGTGKTLEDIVREALVPELKAWLDVRLGPMVERIVREEIKKMVRRAEDL